MKDGEYKIDRLEDGLAFLESDGEETVSVPAELLPSGAADGDVCKVCDGAFSVDESGTARRRKKLFDLAHRLAQKN